jgi:hypothetical protein
VDGERQFSVDALVGANARFGSKFTSAARSDLPRFTEGFDAPDLKDAKALLDELA